MCCGGVVEATGRSLASATLQTRSSRWCRIFMTARTTCSMDWRTTAPSPPWPNWKSTDRTGSTFSTGTLGKGLRQASMWNIGHNVGVKGHRHGYEESTCLKSPDCYGRPVLNTFFFVALKTFRHQRFAKNKKKNNFPHALWLNSELVLRQLWKCLKFQLHK